MSSGLGSCDLAADCELQSELACRDADLDLDAVITLTIKLDCQLRCSSLSPRGHARSLGGVTTPQPLVAQPSPSSENNPKPMQLGAARRRKRMCFQQNLCLYSGGTGHFLAQCPIRHKEKVTHMPLNTFNQFCNKVTLSVANSSVFLIALVHFGSTGNFISASLVSNLSMVNLATPISSVDVVDGRPVSNNPITRKFLSSSHLSRRQMECLAPPLSCLAPPLSIQIQCHALWAS